MLDALRFVQGSVAKKDYVPALQHFRIKNGEIRGYNGMLGLCSPIDLDMDITPRADQLVRAIQACKDTISLHLTPGGKLVVRSGKFKANVDCTTEQFPEVWPEGQRVELPKGFLEKMRIAADFIAEDASRPWARGLLLRGQSIFATNNVILIEGWLPTPFPVTVNIPEAAVLELLRIGEEPEYLHITGNSVTFFFENKRWLKTQTYSAEWPDLSKILDVPSNPSPLPEGFWEALASLDRFTDDHGMLYLEKDSIATSLGDETGASIMLPESLIAGKFNIRHLSLLKSIATRIDFTTYPKPCLFFGDNGFRGAIMGMR